MSEKIYLRDVGSHPERDLEVTLFPDGELQLEADNGKYVHINIAKNGVEEIRRLLNKRATKKRVVFEFDENSKMELGELIEKWKSEGKYNQFIAGCAKELTDILPFIIEEHR